MAGLSRLRATFRGRRADASGPLVFNHIPKSGGTSLRLALAKALHASQVVTGFDRSLFGGFSEFDSVGESQRSLIADTPDILPASPDLVAGHYALSTTRARYPNATHMTVLREARSRVLSHWMYWRTLLDAQLEGMGEWATQVRKSNAPLADFLRDPALSAQLDNVGLRLLLWPHPSIPVDGPIAECNDDQLLAEATARLDSFDYVDVVENPRFETGLSRWLGAPVLLKRHNETSPMPESRRTPLAPELTPAAMAELARCTRLDDVIWRRIAGRRLEAGSVESVRDAAFARSIVRYERLMAS